MTYCPRCDPQKLADSLVEPGKHGAAVLCVACSDYVRSAVFASSCSNCEGWGCVRCAPQQRAQPQPVPPPPPLEDWHPRERPGDLGSWRRARHEHEQKRSAAVALVEALFDADDAAEASPFSVLVLPEAVKVELERCRVLFKRARRD